MSFAAGRLGPLLSVRPFAVAGPLFVVLWWAFWYRGTIVQIVDVWTHSETFAHGMLVTPIVLWLLWRVRDKLQGEARPAWNVLVLVAASGVLWLLGEMVSAAAVSHFAVVGLISAGLWATFGHRQAKVLAFPLLFLFFAAPVGDFLVPWLMQQTAAFTVFGLRLSGIPVYQEGLHFVVPNGRWSVIQACSGIRYLIASLMVGTLYAYLNYRGLRKRLLFVGVAAVVPIVANWIRAYLIVMLGYLSDNRLAAGVDHLIYGWLFFGFVILLMFWLGERWRDADVRKASPEAQVPLVAGHRGVLVHTAVLAGLLAFWPILEARLHPQERSGQVDLAPPVPAEGWQFREQELAGYRPALAGYRGAVTGVYVSDGKQVGFDLAFYADQVQGKELVNWANRLVWPEDTEWYQVAGKQVDLSIGRVASARIRGGSRELQVWHWYQIGDRIVVSDIEAKLRLAQARLTGKSDAAAHVFVIADVTDASPDATDLVERFLAAHRSALAASLQRAEDSLR